MANYFALYQHHAETYSVHSLVDTRAPALPTKMVTIYESTVKNLEKAYKEVRAGFDAWVIPVPEHAPSEMPPPQILWMCEVTVGNGLGRRLK